MPYKPETLEAVLSRFPEQAHRLTEKLFAEHHFLFRITTPRRTRLGSFKGVRYGGRPTIHINSDLGQYTFLLVFLHELAHLVHHNHSTKFWQLVEKVMPDYDRHEKHLAENSAKYYL